MINYLFIYLFIHLINYLINYFIYLFITQNQNHTMLNVPSNRSDVQLQVACDACSCVRHEVLCGCYRITPCLLQVWVPDAVWINRLVCGCHARVRPSPQGPEARDSQHWWWLLSSHCSGMLTVVLHFCAIVHELKVPCSLWVSSCSQSCMPHHHAFTTL